jgi:Tfp pilus assembly protein PilF/ribosomal protein S27E
MLRWKVIGILATSVIILSLPLYVVQEIKRTGTAEVVQPATFVTSKACAKCHKKEYEEWQKSHHAKSMAVATDETVLGDFNNTVFEKDGILSRFYRKAGGFFVHTQGIDGKMADFKISHTFGWYPLQQYLIPFPDGKLQCLPIAWDLKQKTWFHLYPDFDLDPKEWIYWTNQAQNWNSMCADCHSTELKKNYNPDTGAYDTRWTEISVGCESCHGPGSKHLAWAELPEMARPDDDGLMVTTSKTGNRQQVELCAPCHSRRSMLGDYTYQQQDLLDTEVPRLLEDGLYFPDGQIRDEVYVYGSFVQSKMYAHDVRCSDCHNPHTIKLHQKGNALCLQCHQAALYDTGKHHFHKQEGEEGKPILDTDGKVLFKVGSGAQCVQCHMPGRTYMGNDYRPDHSIRIPRPDLSVQLNTPNACNRCHLDKDNQWSAEYTKKWYGSKERYQFGTTFRAGREGELQAQPDLLRLVDDPLTPVLVRATALSLLGRYQGEQVTAAFQKALAGEESLLRRTACASFPGYMNARQAEMIAPLVDDPVQAVRMEAARALTAVPPNQIPAHWQKAFKAALDELIKTSLYSADFAASRLNLGSVYGYLGDVEKAEEQWKKAVAINRDFYTARTNLAVLYSRQGKNDLAEQQLRKALEINPELTNVHYSLGLLLSEQKQYQEAAQHLQKAAAGMGNNARAYYNLGQLLDFLQKDGEAETALRKTLEIDPRNMQYLQTMAKFYLARQNFSQAKEIADQMILADPANPLGRQLLDFISSRVQQ